MIRSDPQCQQGTAAQNRLAAVRSEKPNKSKKKRNPQKVGKRFQSGQVVDIMGEITASTLVEGNLSRIWDLL